MFKTYIACLLLAAVIVFSMAGAAQAAEVECDSIYCFQSEDFSDAALQGICITSLPDASTGTMMLGTRVLRPGDILTAAQLPQMTFLPLRTEVDVSACISYLPIYEEYVAESTTMTIAVLGKEDKAPVAQDFAMETYKNLPNDGNLKVTEPEGQAVTYTVVRQPRRGEVLVRQDGSFTYTPKKNKVGTDSFTYTATDEAGNVSREATVTVRIMKPSTSAQYTDTMGHDCRFTAEWLRSTGIFEGENVGGESCFQPDKTVTRGEFLAMVAKTLNIPMDTEVSYAELPESTPQWLKPYLAAAMRSGLTTGLPEEILKIQEAITGAEAAVILQNALDLTVSAEAEDMADVPAWAASSMTAMSENGIKLAAGQLTRGQLANALYQVSKLAQDAPGMAVFRMNS